MLRQNVVRVRVVRDTKGVLELEQLAATLFGCGGEVLLVLLLARVELLLLELDRGERDGSGLLVELGGALGGLLGGALVGVEGFGFLLVLRGGRES